MSVSPFDLAKSLSEKTELEYDMSDYNPWLTNIIFSNTIDSLFFAEVMNKSVHLPKHIQHDFYKFGLPKGKRFSPWNKPTINTTVNILMDHYQVNMKVAEGYLKLMSATDIENITAQHNEGGKCEIRNKGTSKRSV